MSVLAVFRAKRLRNMHDNVIAARVMRRMLSDVEDFDDVKLTVEFTPTEVIGSIERNS